MKNFYTVAKDVYTALNEIKHDNLADALDELFDLKDSGLEGYKIFKITVEELP